MPLLSLVTLVITAGVVALMVLWPRVRSGPTAPRLVLEVLLLTGGFSALLRRRWPALPRIPW